MAGLDYAATGTSTGIFKRQDNGLVGMFFNYGYQDIDTGARQSANINSLMLGVFLHQRSCCGLFYTLAVAGGHDAYRSSRSTMTGTASGDYDGAQIASSLEVGNTYSWNSLQIEPRAMLQHTYLYQDDFTETGAGISNATVNDTDTNSLRSRLGTRVKLGSHCSKFGVLTPHLDGYWMHEFLDTNTLVSLSQGGAPAFGTRGLDLGRDWLQVGGGGTLELNNSLSIYGSYEAQINDRTSLHTGTAGFSLTW